MCLVINKVSDAAIQNKVCPFQLILEKATGSNCCHNKYNTTANPIRIGKIILEPLIDFKTSCCSLEKSSVGMVLKYLN